MKNLKFIFAIIAMVALLSMAYPTETLTDRNGFTLTNNDRLKGANGAFYHLHAVDDHWELISCTAPDIFDAHQSNTVTMKLMNNTTTHEPCE